MDKKRLLKNQEGFTLVEIIAVLIILGILAAVAVPRYIDLEANAKNRALDAGISELNGRENLTWANAKISPEGYPGDGVLFNGGTFQGQAYVAVDTNLNPGTGTDYTWILAASTTGGTLSFKDPTGAGVALRREVSTTNSPGNWHR